MRHVVPLFPIPVMVVEKLLPSMLVAALAARFTAAAVTCNARSGRLSHTEIVSPSDDPLMREAAVLIEPELVQFGLELFGEELTWSIKEAWGNVLQQGGHQSLHNHANCFISGVVYLTPSHPSANTVFVRHMGDRGFVFENVHCKTRTGAFNAQKWQAPELQPGDLLLFPSYLLHEVPSNEGEVRITMAFNAIPERLDSWGYATRLSA